MIYPKEFIEKCQRLYPDNVKLNQLLEKGSPSVGKFLNESITDSIPLTDILNATSLQELKANALLLQEKHKLLGEWYQRFEKYTFSQVFEFKEYSNFYS